MKLLDYYKEMSQNEEVFNKYYRCGAKDLGNMYFFRNTNFRTIESFIENYLIFKKIDGMDRSKWTLNPSYKQENDKHRTVRMLGSKIFSKDENKYYATEKGQVIEKIIENTADLNKEEKWLLIYMLILDSYFDNKANYIPERSKYIIENIIANGFEEEELEKALVKILLSNNTRRYQMAQYDFLYIDTFFQTYKEYDFLSRYYGASEEEKEELRKYVENNLLKSKNTCIISKKYENGGNYNNPMLIDDARLIYLNKALFDKDNLSFSEYVENVINRFNKVYNINAGKIKKIIYTNRDVYEMVYCNIYGIDIIGIDTPEDSEGDIIEEKIDDTSLKNVEKIKRISSILKRKAKERTSYKCELENLYECNRFYFTSKDTNKNYLEIHHFIPREFSNNYEKTIEIIENYIALCPRCHRMIHLATDRERIPLINYIYDKRKDALKAKGLEVSIEELEDYYGIEH